ncbi:MAG TPA: hypothetical protein VH062_27160 [Polyangiaceae bacterium]|nr:hypothetical protein [Polyangiaceae bacterium]
MAGCLVLACGCSSSSSGSDTLAKPRADSSNGGATNGTGDIAITLNDGVPLVFSPGVAQEVSVAIDPPAVYVVRFSLFGDAEDAYLDKSEAETGRDGMTSVMLTPPSSPVVFKVRASAAGASTELAASAASMRTTLQVIPAYAGQRTISKWIATVDTNSACNLLGSIPPPDGPLTGEGGPNDTISVPNVPLGAPLQVTVRAGQFAGGCTQVPAFALGDRRPISVIVTDRPLQMNGVKIAVTLGIDQSTAWKSAWSTLSTAMTTSAVAGSPSDAGALLDAMTVATPYLTQDAFVYGRGLHEWDDRVEDLLSAGPGSAAIRDSLTRWLATGLPALTKAAISGTLTSAQLSLGAASLAVTSVGGATPADAGFSTTVPLTWSSAAADQVLFGASAVWQPSHVAGALAALAAAREVRASTGVVDALSKTLSCADIGSALARDAADVPFLSCDAACLASRCETALTAMWKKALATAATRVALHVAASGSASIDDSAHPVGFSGSWVGDVSLGGVATQVTGSANGQSPTPAAR